MTIEFVVCSKCGVEVSRVSKEGLCAVCDPTLVIPEGVVKKERKKKDKWDAIEPVGNPPYFQN